MRAVILFAFALCLVTDQVVAQSCTDKNSGCAGFVASGGTFCSSSFGKNNCQKSCGACPTVPPTTVGDPCKDGNPGCSTTFASSCSVTAIQSLCPKTCKKCVPNDGVSCFDTETDADCTDNKKNGLCTADAATMKLQCMKTCALCPPPPTPPTTPPPSGDPCKDGNAGCSTTFASSCSVTAIQDLCPKTCKKCVPNDGVSCFDTESAADCADNNKNGLCSIALLTMKAQCMKTCGLCPPPPTPPPTKPTPPPTAPPAKPKLQTNGVVCCNNLFNRNNCGECANMNCYRCESVCFFGVRGERCVHRW